LHDDVRHFFADPGPAALDTSVTVDGDHGRVETREACVCGDVAWLRQMHGWPGLAAIAKVTRTREVNANTSRDVAYYLLSTVLSANA
jgi:hypothetical protein